MQGRIFNTGLSFVLVVLLSFSACSGRPHRDEAVYGEALQDGTSIDSNNLVTGGDIHPGSRILPNIDDTALAALQLQILQQYANYNSMRNLPWDQIIRAPQDKRQIRYRQCYFNPISCFRK